MAAKSQLDRMMLYKREELAKRKRLVPEADLRASLLLAPAPRDLAAALRHPGVALIPTCQRASPSRGLLRNGYDAASLARAFEQGGAQAVAVQSDAKFYQGSLTDLAAVRGAVGLPVIRTDFLFDPYQLVESRAAGADALLLLATLLPGNRLREMHHAAEGLGMQVIVEVHDEREVVQALEAGATILSLTHRSPYTFEPEGEGIAALRRLLPPSVLALADGAVSEGDDLRTLAALGMDGAILGERVVRAKEVTALLRGWRGTLRSGR